MNRAPGSSIYWRMTYTAVCAFFFNFSHAQSPKVSAVVEAHRVNAIQKFIVVNTYLFDHDAQLSYLYAYNPTTWESAGFSVEPEISVLEPIEDGKTWWAESPFRVVDIDSYVACSDSEEKFACIEHKGAYLATSEEHPELKYDDLFVIKGVPFEIPSDTIDNDSKSVME